ncbi:MAG: hypothetical protein R3F23_06485 [Verrucomicrobiia bacterium]
MTIAISRNTSWITPIVSRTSSLLIPTLNLFSSCEEERDDLLFSFVSFLLLAHPVIKLVAVISDKAIIK